MKINNFRRLKNVSIDLESDTTIFVGANNSGKTSAASILRLFVKGRAKDISIYDFNAASLQTLQEVECLLTDEPVSLPTIVLDLWFEVTEDELYRAVDLLPSLEWDGQPLGIRMQYQPRNPKDLFSRYREAKSEAAERADSTYHPWPNNLFEYLSKKLHTEYELVYMVLESQASTQDAPEHLPAAHPMHNSNGEASAILDGLITLDYLDAQRFLADSEANSRTKDLSRSLSQFYRRNLEKFETDTTVLQALHDSETSFNDHLAQVFQSTLQSLNTLGYPGIENPELVIRSNFTADQIMAHDTTVQYALPRAQDDLFDLHLPEKYNGLGFKNLIFMVIKMLDFHQQWNAQDERTPIHLVIVEEPEAHLHAQLQQVFISKIWEIISDNNDFTTQLVVTTHSAHIINESRFTPIRYFRRTKDANGKHESQVRDVSKLNSLKAESKNFLERYVKLTHCDLFFADAAIMVEGNVERLLLPSIIEKSQPSLTSNYLTILEVGGAFAHKFAPLLQLLGIPTLIITDLDSVNPSVETSQPASNTGGTAESPKGKKTNNPSRKSCPADTPLAVTSNIALRDWHPKKKSIKELLELSEKEKEFSLGDEIPTFLRIAYQTPSNVVREKATLRATGRTFEETFAYENLEWILEETQRPLSVLPARFDPTHASLEEIVEAIYKRVKKSSFKKTEFALSLMLETGKWQAPNYIADGLTWLDSIINDTSMTSNAEGAFTS